jgi:hypothetical protein
MSSWSAKATSGAAIAGLAAIWFSPFVVNGAMKMVDGKMGMNMYWVWFILVVIFYVIVSFFLLWLHETEIAPAIMDPVIP